MSRRRGKNAELIIEKELHETGFIYKKSFNLGGIKFRPLTGLGNHPDTSYIEITFNNSRDTGVITMYLPAKHVDEFITCLQAARPPSEQIKFGEIHDETATEMRRILEKLRREAAKNKEYNISKALI